MNNSLCSRSLYDNNIQTLPNGTFSDMTSLQTLWVLNIVNNIFFCGWQTFVDIQFCLSSWFITLIEIDLYFLSEFAKSDGAFFLWEWFSGCGRANSLEVREFVLCVNAFFLFASSYFLSTLLFVRDNNTPSILAFT